MKNKSLHSSSTFHLSISKQFEWRRNYAIYGNTFSPARALRKLQHEAVQRLVPGCCGAYDRFSDLTQARECCPSPPSRLLLSPSPASSSHSCCQNLVGTPCGLGILLLPPAPSFLHSFLASHLASHFGKHSPDPKGLTG